MSATYLQHLFFDARSVELRVHLGERWLSGQFDSASALQQTADAHAGGNLYTTLNRPAARSAIPNAMGSKPTCDADIAAVVRLPFDFDPVRPVGESSTQVELETATRKRNQFIAMLMALQWPMPALAISGNGAHALYRCFLKPDSATREMLTLVYRGLRSDFSDEQVSFDPSVRNPARIWRLYGTVNRKGTATVERPHRLAEVRIPSRWDGVGPKQVEALANRYAREPEKVRRGTILPPAAKLKPCGVIGGGDFGTLDAPAWFAAHGALKRSLGTGKHAVTCPWCDEHSTPDAPHGTDSVIWEAQAGRWPTFHCSHAHCETRSIVDVMRRWGDADRYCARAYRRSAA